MVGGEKNTMHALECGGVIIEGTKMLLVHANNFYRKLFGPAPAS